MPRKLAENLILEPNYETHSFRQPKGINVRAIAKAHNMSINGLLRTALLDYLDRYPVGQNDVDICV